jgi:hypothetical protein
MLEERPYVDTKVVAIVLLGVGSEVARLQVGQPQLGQVAERAGDGEHSPRPWPGRSTSLAFNSDVAVLALAPVAVTRRRRPSTSRYLAEARYRPAAMRFT